MRAHMKFAEALWFNMIYGCINIKILADTDKPIIIFMLWSITDKRSI